MRLTCTFLWLLVSTFALAQDRDTLPISPRTASGGKTSPTGLFGTKNPGVSAADIKKFQQQQENTADNPPQAVLGTPYVASVDTFGSSRLNATILKETLGPDLNVWLTKGVQANADAVELETRLLERIQKKFGFAMAEFSVLEYYEPGDLAIRVTLDVVEKADVARRMPFKPEPTQQFKDPDSLISKWMEYEDIAMELVDSGQLNPETENCVAYHCPFGHKHPKLKKYEKLFVDGVKKYEKQLVEILGKDQRADFRAAAAYLLAYTKDGQKLVNWLVERIYDSDYVVRNNAMRVLGDVAEFHPEFIIPLHPILQALQFPRVSDRSKAVYVAYTMAVNSPQTREEIKRSAIPELLAMLDAKQPDEAEISYDLLKKISGKDYPPTDLQAWNNWYAHLPKERNSLTRKAGLTQ
jgi:hypothetical protein